MSDWSTAWTGMREGLAAGAQLRETRNNRELQRDLENQRLELERRRLSDSELTSGLNRDLLRHRLTALQSPLTTPDGMVEIGRTRSAEGETSATYAPTPNIGTPTPIPGTTQSVVSIGGVPHLVNQDLMSRYLQMPGGMGAPTAPQAPGPAGIPPSVDPAGELNAGGGALPPVNLPPHGQAPAGAPQVRMTGLSEHGPTFGMSYPSTPPTVVSTRAPGMPFDTQFYTSTNPNTGQLEYHPLPESQMQGKVTERQQSIAGILTAKRLAHELQDTVAKHGNWESGFWPGDPEAHAALGAIPVQLSMAMAKAMNPGAVAREGQVELDRKYLVPTGLTVRNAVTQAAIKRLLADIDSRSAELKLGDEASRQSREMEHIYPDEAAAQAAAAAGAIPAGQVVTINGKTMRWEPSAK